MIQGELTIGSRMTVYADISLTRPDQGPARFAITRCANYSRAHRERRAAKVELQAEQRSSFTRAKQVASLVHADSLIRLVKRVCSFLWLYLFVDRTADPHSSLLHHPFRGSQRKFLSNGPFACRYDNFWRNLCGSLPSLCVSLCSFVILYLLPIDYT